MSTTALFFNFLVTVAIVSQATADFTYSDVCKSLFTLGEKLHSFSLPSEDGVVRPYVEFDELREMTHVYNSYSDTRKRFVGVKEASSASSYLEPTRGRQSLLEVWPMVEPYCAWKQQASAPDGVDFTGWENEARHSFGQRLQPIFDQVVLLSCNFLAPQRSLISRDGNEVQEFLDTAGAILERINDRHERNPNVVLQAIPSMGLGRAAVFNWKEIVHACQMVYASVFPAKHMANIDGKYLACTTLGVPYIGSDWGQ